jgi:multiple sugar transport system substrate-binding protein
LSLDPYLEKSKVLKKEDLASINEMWRWDGKQVGQGPYYGLAKDWSLDGMLWCNTTLFKKAGVTPLRTTDPITYDQLLDIGKKLAVKQGDKIQVYGLDAAWPSSALGMANIYQMIMQQGGKVFSSDLTQANFTTPEALKSLQWYVDYTQAHIGPTPLDPDPNGWDGPTYLVNRMGITLNGYWFAGEIATGTPALQASALLAPAPLMGSKRISSCYAGTGIWIAANAKNKDAAWAFMEYFIAGTPAHDRAKSGWGVSSLKSLFSEMPQTQPYQKQAYQTVQEELKYFAPLTISPYATTTGIGTILDKYLQQAAKNQLTVSAAAQQITSEVNKLLQQGKQAIS